MDPASMEIGLQSNEFVRPFTLHRPAENRRRQSTSNIPTINLSTICSPYASPRSPDLSLLQHRHSDTFRPPLPPSVSCGSINITPYDSSRYPPIVQYQRTISSMSSQDSSHCSSSYFNVNQNKGFINDSLNSQFYENSQQSEVGIRDSSFCMKGGLVYNLWWMVFNFMMLLVLVGTVLSWGVYLTHREFADLLIGGGLTVAFVCIRCLAIYFDRFIV